MQKVSPKFTVCKSIKKKPPSHLRYFKWNLIKKIWKISAFNEQLKAIWAMSFYESIYSNDCTNDRTFKFYPPHLRMLNFAVIVPLHLSKKKLLNNFKFRWFLQSSTVNLFNNIVSMLDYYVRHFRLNGFYQWRCILIPSVFSYSFNIYNFVQIIRDSKFQCVYSN